MQDVDVMENNVYNVLLTGSSNASINRSRLSRSKTQGGLTMWQASYARLTNSEVSENGYTLSFDPSVNVPDGGKGIDLRDDSELYAKANIIDANKVMGVIGVNRTVVRLEENRVTSTGLTGILVCGVAPNEATTSIVTGNWIANNGALRPDLG